MSVAGSDQEQLRQRCGDAGTGVPVIDGLCRALGSGRSGAGGRRGDWHGREPDFGCTGLLLNPVPGPAGIRRGAAGPGPVPRTPPSSVSNQINCNRTMGNCEPC